MILIDAGPMVSLFWARDPNHTLCLGALTGMATAFHSTWPAVTEAMHFLGKYAGWQAQQALARQILASRIIVETLSETGTIRAFELMEKYRDTPMDLADATLVALAEQLDCKTIFTLDGDFQIYKFKNRAAFKIVPQ
jgi:predicted nucleic acid-binding protein